MKAIDSIIFDLDGTLWDSRQVVATARNNVVTRLDLGMPNFSADDITKTMGLTLDKVYEIAFPKIDRSRHAEIREHLDREICDVLFSDGATLYPGVNEVLNELKKDLKLFIVSNCSVRYLEAFLAWSGLSEFFNDCACYGTKSLPKAENIKLIVQRNSLLKPVYVGDTSGDHEAALAAGVSYIHADYGFGKPNSDCARISAFTHLRTEIMRL